MNVKVLSRDKTLTMCFWWSSSPVIVWICVCQQPIPALKTIPLDSKFCSLFVFSSMAFCWLDKLSSWLDKLWWSPLTLASNWLNFTVSLCRVVTNLSWKWNLMEIWCRLTKQVTISTIAWNITFSLINPPYHYQHTIN